MKVKEELEEKASKLERLVIRLFKGNRDKRKIKNFKRYKPRIERNGKRYRINAQGNRD